MITAGASIHWMEWSLVFPRFREVLEAEDVADIFTRGVAFLHSMEYPEARAEFQAVAGQDPTCGIAHWGEAMTYLHPVWPSPMSAERFRAGIIAAEKAEAAGAQTERE
jgi:hypothetical protein